MRTRLAAFLWLFPLLAFGQNPLLRQFFTTNYIHTTNLPAFGDVFKIDTVNAPNYVTGHWATAASGTAVTFDNTQFGGEPAGTNIISGANTTNLNAFGVVVMTNVSAPQNFFMSVSGSQPAMSNRAGRYSPDTMIGNSNSITFNKQVGWGNTIAGGFRNGINEGLGIGHTSIIGAGDGNFIHESGDSVIGGGASNLVASVSASVVPGGSNNTVRGSYSWAGGRDASALHDNVFVWSDGSLGNLSSTTNGQFLVAASHGVGINLNDAGTNGLRVFGNIDSTIGFTVNGVPYGGGGGSSNNLDPLTCFANNSLYSTGALIFHGIGNTIRSNSDYAVILGGSQNTITGMNSFIGAGHGNIAGGDDNFIGAGTSNRTIGPNVTVSGGWNNVATGDDATIAGGKDNSVLMRNSVIGGGTGNAIYTNTEWATIAGGTGNSISNGQWNSIGGGSANQVYGQANTIGGGGANYVTGNNSTIGGGSVNLITNNANGGQTIAGGEQNMLHDGDVNFIGSGNFNGIGASYQSGNWFIWRGSNVASAIAGGYGNTVQSDLGFIGSGFFNLCMGWGGVVVGGIQNSVFPSQHSFIGGGRANIIYGTNDVIVGGFGSTIDTNAISSFIGGGYQNFILSGSNNVIPGGFSNVINSDFSFAAGTMAEAQHDNSFVWSDGSSGIFSTTTNNQFLILSTNGVGININNPGTNALKVAGNVDSTVGFSINGVPLTNGGGGAVSGVVLTNSGYTQQVGGIFNSAWGLTDTNSGQLLLMKSNSVVVGRGLFVLNGGITNFWPNGDGFVGPAVYGNAGSLTLGPSFTNTMMLIGGSWIDTYGNLIDHGALNVGLTFQVTSPSNTSWVGQGNNPAFHFDATDFFFDVPFTGSGSNLTLTDGLTVTSDANFEGNVNIGGNLIVSNASSFSNDVIIASTDNRKSIRLNTNGTVMISNAVGVVTIGSGAITLTNLQVAGTKTDHTFIITNIPTGTAFKIGAPYSAFSTPYALWFNTNRSLLAGADIYSYGGNLDGAGHYGTIGQGYFTAVANSAAIDPSYNIVNSYDSSRAKFGCRNGWFGLTWSTNGSVFWPGVAIGTNSGNVAIGHTNTTFAWLYLSNLCGSTVSNAFRLDTVAGINSLVVGTNGNVGIGVAAPSSKLNIIDVAAGGTAGILTLRNNSASTSSAGKIRFENSTSDGSDSGAGEIIVTRKASSGGAMALRTSVAGNPVADRLVIDDAGNVGVGITTPDSLLTVSNTTAATLFKVAGGPHSSNTLFQVNSNATVGIGVASPTAGFSLETSSHVKVGGNLQVPNSVQVGSLAGYGATGFVDLYDGNALRFNHNAAANGVKLATNGAGGLILSDWNGVMGSSNGLAMGGLLTAYDIQANHYTFSPVYYDLNDSTYFIAPASGGTAGRFKGTVTVGGSLIGTNGGTFGAPVTSTSSSTSSPAATEFVVAEWVRGLFSGGTLLYNCTNQQNIFTNYDLWYSALPTTNAVQQARTYTGVTNNQYLGTGIASTNRYQQLNSPMTVNAYLSFNTGGGRSVSVHPEFYYCYEEPKTNNPGVFTNLLGDYVAGAQSLIPGTNLYTWVISFPTVVSTNANGFWAIRRFKVDAQTANPNVTIHGSGNTPSTIGFNNPTVTSSGMVQYDQNSVITNVLMNGSYQSNTISTVFNLLAPRQFFSTNAAANITFTGVTGFNTNGEREATASFMASGGDIAITIPNPVRTPDGQRIYYVSNGMSGELTVKAWGFNTYTGAAFRIIY